MINRLRDIDGEEFANRRRRAAHTASLRGLDGLVVCSRGGGSLDRYGDVFYLTNFYTPFPYIPDLPGHWSCRAHAFLVLPVKGEPRLIVDVPYLSEVALPPESIVITETVVEATIDAVREAGLAQGRIGIVGDDVIPWRAARALQNDLPDAEWAPADDLLRPLRAVKSAGEVCRLREAAKIGSRALEAMLDAAVPGATHGDLVASCQDVLVRGGGILYNSFMASGTGGDDSAPVIRSNFPTWASPERLVEGQWLRLGISGVYAGYYFDVSRARAIGDATSQQIEAFEAAIAAVQAGIAAMRPGVTAGEVATAGLNRQEELGFPLKGVFSGLGHGIGVGWDDPWLVPGEPTVLEPGMVLNVERTLQRDGYLGDFEETALLTEDGPQVLTDAKARSW